MLIPFHMALFMILIITFHNFSDEIDLGLSPCMKGIHTNGTAPKLEEKPYKSELSLLDIYSGCGGMSTGLCLGASLSGLTLVTVNSIQSSDSFSDACY